MILVISSLKKSLTRGMFKIFGSNEETHSFPENGSLINHHPVLRACSSLSKFTPGHTPAENPNSERHMHLNFTAARSTAVRTWEQPKCPSTEECIKRMWYIYTMEYYSTIKWNKIVPFADVGGHRDSHTE